MKPRISPIDKPKGIFKKIMFAVIKKQFGKVIMSARVIYARYPKIGMLVKKIYGIEHSMKLVQEPEKLLIQNLVATLNGCTYCMDLSMKQAIDKNIGLEKFYDLLVYKSSEKYTDREKSIFNYVEEMTKTITVTDETFDKLKKHCSDEEIIEITFVSASENYLNRLVKPLNIGSDDLCAIK